MISEDRQNGYAMGNALPDERTRLAAIEQAYDAVTMQHLRRLGARPGARILVVGAGTGSFAPQLANITGPTGTVHLTDLDPRFLWQLAARYTNVTVQRHDAAKEEFMRDSFDIAHARLVLIHLPERVEIIDKMISALKPGGWLLIEDYDWASYGPAYPSPEEDKAIAVVRTHLRRTGFEPNFGRRLPSIMRTKGLLDVDAVGRVITLRGAGSPLATLYWHSFQRFTPHLVGAGLLDADEVRAAFARLDDPHYDMISQTMMSAWGRRPQPDP